MKTLMVCVECTAVGWSEEFEIELPDDATDEDAEDIAATEFSNVCSYGWAWKE